MSKDNAKKTTTTQTAIDNNTVKMADSAKTARDATAKTVLTKSGKGTKNAATTTTPVVTQTTQEDTATAMFDGDKRDKKVMLYLTARQFQDLKDFCYLTRQSVNEFASGLLDGVLRTDETQNALKAFREMSSGLQSLSRQKNNDRSF